MSYTLYLPGTIGNYISTPDAPSLDITGDIDLRIQCALDSWTPSTTTSFIAKYAGSPNNSFILYTTSSGKLFLNLSPDGTTINTATSSVATGFAAGSTNWIRVTWEHYSGTVEFYTSTDGITWTNLGTPQILQPGFAIFNSNAPLEIGSAFAGIGDFLTGRIYQAQIRNGINGTIVANPKFNVLPPTISPSYVVVQDLLGINGFFNSSNADFAGNDIGWSQTKTFNVDASLAVTGVSQPTGGYSLFLNGLNGNYISAPDATSLDLIGDIDIRVLCSMDNWTPSGTQAFIAKWITTNNERSLVFYTSSTGRLSLTLSPDGISSANVVSSSIATGFSAGSVNWVRVYWQMSSGNTIFYTSSDGVNWTQLGTTQSLQAGTSIFNSNSPLEIGSAFNGGGDMFAGRVYKTQIYNAANSATTYAPVVGLDFTKQPALEQPSYVVVQDLYGANGFFNPINADLTSNDIGWSQAKSHNIDYWLKQTQHSTYQVDSELRNSLIKTYQVDSDLLKITHRTGSVDADLKQTIRITTQVDYWLFKRNTKTYTVDSDLAKLNVHRTVLVDAWVLLPGTRIYSVDSTLVVSKGGVLIYLRNAGENGIVIKDRSHPLQILKIS